TRQSISQTLQIPCPCCNGTGKVLSPETTVLKVRKMLHKNMLNGTMKHYLVEVHSEIADLIEECSYTKTPLLPVAQGRSVYVKVVPEFNIEEFRIHPLPKAPENTEGLRRYD
ncbi:MAG TPA: hypothetical protein PKX46_06580, partial [Clostridia bacterium]|nr:hypothetical protein [Clostridia bacterium]